MVDPSQGAGHRRWARLRLAVIGPLLSSPPEQGELAERLRELASKTYTHPISKAPTQFGVSTIAQWYQAARDVDDPIGVLTRRVRSDSGTNRALSDKLKSTLSDQFKAHKSWSYQLHLDNLEALVEKDPHLGDLPSYWTLRRFMVQAGFVPQKRRRMVREGEAEPAPKEARDVRSYEVEHVHALWHYDYHAGSRKVLLRSGEWVKTILLAFLDDHSRLCCHAQWYLQEDTESFVHGLCQALQKRGLPRETLGDNGGPMTAAEVETGLDDLSITSHHTMSKSPYQNGKQEVFWAQVEGRLLPMLEGVEDLTLEFLNEATQAWVEQEYNRKVHSETSQTPIERALASPDVARPAPPSERLRELFTRIEERTVRKSDGTLSLKGVRFELPVAYRHLARPSVRYAQWDLSRAYLVDKRDPKIILTRIKPLDRAENADGLRRVLCPRAPSDDRPAPGSGVAPHLQRLMDKYQSTGLPPAYLPRAKEN